MLSKFILDIAKDENDQSANYLYILFETTALTIRNLSSNQQALSQVEAQVSQALSFILENNKTELMGYAFQVFSMFVSLSSEYAPMYEAIT